MTQTNESNQNQEVNQTQGFYAQPRAYLSKDGQYLTLVLPGDMRIRKSVNWFKKILGVPFIPKGAMEASL